MKPPALKTKDKILATSLRLFNERGERNVSTNHIAAELGIGYACLAVSVNWAAGIKGLGDIHAEIEQSIDAGMNKVRGILARALPVLTHLSA
mgnify:CR=1 FL=1